MTRSSTLPLCEAASRLLKNAHLLLVVKKAQGNLHRIPTEKGK